MVDGAILDLSRSSVMNQQIKNFGPHPKDFIRHVSTLPGVTLGKGLPPSTDQILGMLATAEAGGTLTPQQAEFSASLGHLRLDAGFRELLHARIAVEQRPLSLSICCPTMPRDAMGKTPNWQKLVQQSLVPLNN